MATLRSTASQEGCCGGFREGISSLGRSQFAVVVRAVIVHFVVKLGNLTANCFGVRRRWIWSLIPSIYMRKLVLYVALRFMTAVTLVA